MRTTRTTRIGDLLKLDLTIQTLDPRFHSRLEDPLVWEAIQGQLLAALESTTGSIHLLAGLLSRPAPGISSQALEPGDQGADQGADQGTPSGPVQGSAALKIIKDFAPGLPTPPLAQALEAPGSSSYGKPFGGGRDPDPTIECGHCQTVFGRVPANAAAPATGLLSLARVVWDVPWNAEFSRMLPGTPITCPKCQHPLDFRKTPTGWIGR